MKIRTFKRLKYQRYQIGMGDRYVWVAEEGARINMASVERKFGSPDYEKLIVQDRRREAIRAIRAFPKVPVLSGTTKRLLEEGRNRHDARHFQQTDECVHFRDK